MFRDHFYMPHWLVSFRLLGWGMVLRFVPRWVVWRFVALCLRFLFFVLLISPAFVPLGLTRLTLDDCLVVLVTDGLMPQGARVTKKLALRWFESDITWYGRWENWKVRDDEGSPSSPRTDVKELISEWQAELSETL